MYDAAPSVLAACLGMASGLVSVFAQTPTDAAQWFTALGPSAGVFAVAYVAIVYIRKRDEDQKELATSWQAQIGRIQDRIEAMAKENRDALDKVVSRMEATIRDNATAHDNGLQQIGGLMSNMINTVAQFQRTQDEIVTHLRIARILPGEEEPDADGWADGKTFRPPANKPKPRG